MVSGLFAWRLALPAEIGAVDSVTQATLGAVCGSLVLGKHLGGRRAILWGLLAGTVPDLDAILMPFFDTKWDLRIHRGFSHSILVMALATWLLAKPLARLWKKQKVTPKRAAFFVFLVWSTHVLIDCFTVYGTQIFWPISSHPVSFDNLFIIDPLFTLPLLVAMIWGFCINDKQWKKGVGMRMTSICLLVSCLYVGISFWVKHVVSTRFENDLTTRDVSYQRRMESPAPFSIIMWRSVVERDDEFWVGYRSLFDGDVPVNWTVYPKGPDLGETGNAPAVETVKWFSKGWYIARPTARGCWLVDLRFGEYRDWDDRGMELRPVFAWEYQADGRGDPLKMGGRPEVKKRDFFGKLWKRMRGDREGWDEPPRLIGNPSTLQEHLQVIQ